MRKRHLQSSLIGLFLAAGFVFLSGTPVLAQKIPALSEIPADLPIGVRMQFLQRRQALEKELAAFQAAARNFNAKAAKDQSDSEYSSLAAWRTRYMDAARSFNKDVAEAPVLPRQPGKTTPYTVKFGSASGEFRLENSDGSRWTNENMQAGRIARVDTGTRVTTGPTGRIQLILPDETVFTIGPKSDMVIDEFVYDQENAEKISVRLTIGLFRWVTGKVAPLDRAQMQIRTRWVCGGFRGTDVESYVGPDGSGFMKLFSGRIEITPNNGGAPFMMNAQSVMEFKADGTFSLPEAIKE
jgi:hypothetical protein